MEEIVEEAKKGNEKAYDKLIISIEQEMYLIAKTQLKNEEDISDAIQETILLCFKNIKKLRNNAFFKTWIIKILLNECKKIYKKKMKKTISLEEENIENLIKTEENFEENISFDFLIKDLKEDEQLILTLYYCSEYTTKEISKILKINEATIRSKMSRAKIKLRKKFEGGKYERY